MTINEMVEKPKELTFYMLEINLQLSTLIRFISSLE